MNLNTSSDWKNSLLGPKVSSARMAAVSALWLGAAWTSLFALSDKALQEDMDYRKDRSSWMRSERSPLALAGLFWLKAGRNSFGTDPSNDFVLPAGGAPGRVGYFELKGKTVTVNTESGRTLRLHGHVVDHRELKTDAGGAQPDVLELDYLRMKVIQRGDKLAVRLVDLRNPTLLAFQSLAFYEIRPELRVEATFVPYQTPKKIKVATVAGYVEELDCPGVAQFSVDGTNVQLEPVIETPGDTKLFYMFKDLTNGKETYGGGRYLYSDLPSKGRVKLNFNQAHNPYCAYNSYSTCLIPPVQNWLKVPIRAGEKKYPESK